jgi:hypothetical protein
MRYRLSFGIVALLALSLLVSACSIVREQNQKDSFERKNKDFVLRMQWSKPVGVSLHFQQDLREPFLERFEDWSEFKVTDINIARMSSEQDGTVERRTVYYNLEYYLLTDMRVHKEKIKMVWELQSKTGDNATYWRIVTPFPDLEVERK